MGMEPASMCHLAQTHDLGPDAAIVQIRDGKQRENERRAAFPSSSDRDQAIQRFGRYCQSFYNSSLVLTNSSSSLDQDKIVGYAMSYDRSQGKIVMEAIDRIGAMRAAVDTCLVSNAAEVQNSARESLAKLRREHELIAECHGDLLGECGLLVVDKFIDPDLSSAPEERAGSIGYEQYTQVRDLIRRRSHKSAMSQRQSSLYQLLSESEQAISKCESTTRDESISLTRLKHVKHAIAATKEFVRKYQPNIGSHSFLAGLHRLIHLQLYPQSKRSGDPTYIVQWNFLGSVVTEACHSNDEGDTEAYARDAMTVLFSFLTWIKSNDVEGGRCSNLEHDNFDLDNSLEQEPMLTFQVNKYISDANLRRILSVLPNPKVLDARATGQIDVFDGSKNVHVRMNLDGHLDEQWPWWQFCNVL